MSQNTTFRCSSILELYKDQYQRVLQNYRQRMPQLLKQTSQQYKHFKY